MEDADDAILDAMNGDMSQTLIPCWEPSKTMKTDETHLPYRLAQRSTQVTRVGAFGTMTLTLGHRWLLSLPINGASTGPSTGTVVARRIVMLEPLNSDGFSKTDSIRQHN